MGYERRRAERVPANLPVQWEGAFAKAEGTIADISTGGCFILTGGEVQDGELISVEINLPQMLRMSLWGNVVYRAKEIGFAMRFKDLSITEQTLLKRVIEHVRPKTRA